MAGRGRTDGAVCWLAPMLGVHGRVPDVFESLGPGLAARGRPAVMASSRVARVPRLVEQVRELHAHRRDLSAVVVHVYSGAGFVVADVLSAQARRARLPLIGYLSGGGLPDLAERHPRWVRRVLGRFDVVNAPSPFLGRFAEGLGLTTEVIPNPVDIERFPYRHRAQCDPTMLWMRSFHEVYRPEAAVRVLAEVRRTHPRARLTMAGADKGLLASTRALADDLGVADAIEFPGFIDPAARLAALASHDVFLHTNRVDNTPVSLLEAAASGLPIVASAVGGIPDLLTDGVEALLVPEGEVGGLAHAVSRVVDDPAFASRLSAAAHERVLAASLETVLDRWETLLDGVTRATT